MNKLGKYWGASKQRLGTGTGSITPPARELPCLFD